MSPLLAEVHNYMCDNSSHISTLQTFITHFQSQKSLKTIPNIKTPKPNPESVKSPNTKSMTSSVSKVQLYSFTFGISNSNMLKV